MSRVIVLLRMRLLKKRVIGPALLVASYLLSGLTNASPVVQPALKAPYTRNVVIVVAPPVSVAPGADAGAVSAQPIQPLDRQAIIPRTIAFSSL